MPKTINCILQSLASSCTVLTFPGNKSQLFWHYMFSCPSSKPPFCPPPPTRQTKEGLLDSTLCCCCNDHIWPPSQRFDLPPSPSSCTKLEQPPFLFSPIPHLSVWQRKGGSTGQRRQRRQILHKKRGGTPAASPGITLSPGRSGARYCCWRRKYPLEERNEALKLKIFLCFAFFITN